MIRKIFGTLVEKIKRIRITSYDECYRDMKNRHFTYMGSCCGVVGGTKSTGYLSEHCINCPYFKMMEV